MGALRSFLDGRYLVTGAACWGKSTYLWWRAYKRWLSVVRLKIKLRRKDDTAVHMMAEELFASCATHRDLFDQFSQLDRISAQFCLCRYDTYLETSLPPWFWSDKNRPSLFISVQDIPGHFCSILLMFSVSPACIAGTTHSYAWGKA